LLKPCCNKPSYEKAYVWFWPFKAKYCTNCGEVLNDNGPIIEFIWIYFIWPFWDGRVKVIFSKEERESLKQDLNDLGFK